MKILKDPAVVGLITEIDEILQETLGNENTEQYDPPHQHTIEVSGSQRMQYPDPEKLKEKLTNLVSRINELVEIENAPEMHSMKSQTTRRWVDRGRRNTTAQGPFL